MSGNYLKVLFLTACFLCWFPSYSYRYAVVINQEAYAEADWKVVADELLIRHGGFESQLFQWSTDVSETVPALGAFKPDYIGFVGRPVTDVNSAFVHAVHQLCRALDEDIYADAVYGIITGFKAGDALRAIRDSVLVRTAVIAHQGFDFTGFHNNSQYPGYRHFYQSIYTSEGGIDYPATQVTFPDGSVHLENKALEDQPDRIITYSNWLSRDSVSVSVPGAGTVKGTFDFFSTSGHGNINSWQAQFPSALTEGFLRSDQGKLYGSPASGGNIPVSAPVPKIYFATGNCLIGTPDDIDNMPYAWFHTGRAVNMFGYIVNSGYGYMGWGNYERFVHFPGVYSAAECYFITSQSLLYDLQAGTPGVSVSQLEHYRDNTVLYGDPKAFAYSQSFGDSACIYLQTLDRLPAAGAAPDTFVYSVTPHHHDLQGGSSFLDFYNCLRPFRFLPVRTDPGTIAIERNDGHGAAITDNFVLWDLLHLNEKAAKGETRVLRWTAKVTGDLTGIPIQGKSRDMDLPRLTLFRSPHSRSLVLRLHGFQGQVELAVRNASGKRLLSTRFTCCKREAEKRFDFALGFFPAGVYTVTAEGNNTRLTRQFVHFSSAY